MSETLFVRGAREARLIAPFAIVGVLAFFLDYFVLRLALGLGCPRLAARAISIAVAMHFTFAINRVWTFKAHRSAPFVQQWLGYIAANSLGALINYAIFAALSAPGRWFAHAPFLAVAAGSITSMAVNFTGSRLIAFRR